MTALTPTTLAAALPALESLVELKRLRPSLWYEPHKRGQRQFHESKHLIRVLFPGNRWGKTTAMAVEANWWLNHSHPYQPTPPEKIEAVWFCPQRDQFDQLRDQIETECFDRGWVWRDQDMTYEWPNGSKLKVWSAYTDGLWQRIQGINPHLVLCDEEPPLMVWRELRRRGAGRRTTRYVIAATATKGSSWMEEELWKPWAEANTAAGATIGDGGTAVEVQAHPKIWCWDFGGIDDNPGTTSGQREDAKEQATRNEAERRVRLRGGFARFTGNPVFAYDGMERLMARADALTKRNKGTCGWVKTA